ncbi:hypothetical protein CCHL11_09776 [Colletotrichum chlorophyti]|uniref:Zn(2)-C6 fungal-type domain-containing protein n=1 Tax=Colletotrichum chlorophyti TaxID=708187 RepID=A0A1Q8RDA8_9PEZI|nr:hypothetical protein CCHL11_09776 [Colletotrichum chlorophyti]
MSLDVSIPGTGVFSIADPARKKSKRTRASAAKCNVYSKTRHLKCDEEKPVCKRCLRDKRKCDRYPDNPHDRRIRRTVISESCSSPPFANTQSCSASSRLRLRSGTHLTPPVNWDIVGSNLERSMFHHVHRCTVTDFGLASPLTKFWSNYILPLAHYSDSVKHAVIALGVAHKAFLENPLHDGEPSDPMMALSNLAARQYQKAITETIQVMADPSSANVRITLICCIVFICFEIVTGRYDNAVQHLKSGSKVLESLRQAAVSNQRSSGSVVSLPDRPLVETVEKYFDQLCDITDLFTCLGLWATKLIETDVIPDLSFFTWPETETENDVKKPFDSFSDARHQLYHVELMFDKYYPDFSPCDEKGCWHAVPIKAPFKFPETIGAKHEWEEALACLEIWCARFELFQKGLPEKLDLKDREELKYLQFAQLSWQVLSKYRKACRLEKADMGELTRIIDMAEDITLSKESTQRPTFSLEAVIVPTVSYICAFCQNPDLERRIIDLLRQMKRRENMWDSQQLASVYEFLLSERLASQWRYEYNWETLPGIAKMMSDLSINGEQLAVTTPLTLL